jgi:predicted nicotinamide N-methyase
MPGPDARGDQLCDDRAMTSSTARSFVVRETRLQPVPGLDGIQLHLADDALALWRAVQVASDDDDAPLPYWGFAWSGGLALAHLLQDRPAMVAGRRVLDLASGSGLVAIAAMRAGADRALASDIDPFAHAAIALNARANQVRIGVLARDLLEESPPDVDVILAGDCFYEAALAERVRRWLMEARRRGIEVFVGDPGRRHLPLLDLVRIAAYEVRTTTELEDLERTWAVAYAFGTRVTGDGDAQAGHGDAGARPYAGG